MNDEEALELLARLFHGRRWPVAVRILEGVHLVRMGMPLNEAAKAIRTTPRRLRGVIDSGEPVTSVLGVAPSAVTDDHRRKAIQILGQMLVGRAAENVFLERYKEEMESEELELVETTAAGTDTDYRLTNGQKRPIFRINIKFHGSQFRQALDWVGLEPADCFALATYKIRSALDKQQVEGLPYFFAIVGVPHLTAARTGAEFPPEIIEVSAAVLNSDNVDQKRKFEDAVIDTAVTSSFPIYESTYAAIRAADWYILSARRADQKLHELLFERVYALRVRNFARAFRGAEVDMHFSLSGDLTPLSRFFELLKESGVARVSTLLERGEL